jgi:hypothetical protein
VDAQISTEAEFVGQYFKQSPELEEIFSIWNFQISNQVVSLETLILDLLAYSITCSKKIGNRSIGTAGARRCIREYMATLFRNLTSGKHVLIQSTLRLLVALVMHGSNTTRELLDHFNFTLKSLGSFLKIRKKYTHGDAAEDIRTLYIRFIFGFIIRGDVSVKQSILETKNIFGPMMKDLKDDPYWTVDFVLSAIMRGVVHEGRLTKSSKMSLFVHQTMESFISLYQCKGTAAKDRLNDKTVSDCIHSFMINLCCSESIFSSKDGWGSFGDSNLIQKYTHSHLLLKLMQQLKLIEDPLQKELLLGILAANPDLVYHYWKNVQQFSFEPRSSIHFLANATVATSIIRLSAPESLTCKIDEFSPINPPSIAHSLANVLPPPLTKSILSKALQFPSRDVRFVCGQVLLSSFQKLDSVLAEADRLIENIRKKDYLNENQESLNLWKEWREILLSEFRQHLPDTQVVIALQKSSQEEPEEDDSLTIEDLQLSHLKIMKYYQIYNADQMRESRYDFGKLITANSSKWSSVVYCQFLDVISTVENFKWWNKSSDSQKPHIRFFLESYMNAEDDLERKLETLFFLLFSPSYLFQRHPWFVLTVFRKLKHFHFPSLLAYFEKLLVSFGQNPFGIIDLCLDFCQSLKADQIYIDESNLPIAPLLVLMTKSISQSTSESYFLAALILDHCTQCRAPESAVILLHLLKGTVDDMALKKVSHWIQLKTLTDTVMIADDGDSISFENALKMLTVGNVPEIIMTIDPLSFSKKWHDLNNTVNNLPYLAFYSQLCVGDIKNDIEELMEVLKPSIFWLLDMLFLDSNWKPVKSKTTLILDQEIKKLIAEQDASDEELVAQVSAVLFFCYFWLIRHESSVGPVGLALHYLILLITSHSDNSLQKMLSQFLLDHPFITMHYLNPEIAEIQISIQNFNLELIDIIAFCTRFTKSDRIKQKLVENLCSGLKTSSASPYVLDAFKRHAGLLQKEDLTNLYPLLLKNNRIDSDWVETWLEVCKEMRVDQIEFTTGMIEKYMNQKQNISSKLIQIVKNSPSLVVKKIVNSISEIQFKNLLKSKHDDDFYFGTWLAMHSESLGLQLAEWTTNRTIDFSRAKSVIAALNNHLVDSNWGVDEHGPLDLKKALKSFCKSHIHSFLEYFRELLDNHEGVIDQEMLYLITGFIYNSSKFQKKIRNLLNGYMLSPIANPIRVFKVLEIVSNYDPGVLEVGLWSFVSYIEKEKKKLPCKDATIYSQYLKSKCESRTIHNQDLLSKAFKTFLKYQMNNPAILQLLNVLVKNVSLADKSRYLSMIVTHSAYITILQGTKREQSLSPIPIAHPAKASLLQLIYTMMNDHPEQLCQVDHLKPIMTHYHGTIHESDQQSALLFKLFEKYGISMAPYISLWGNHGELTAATGNLNESLNQVDSNWMMHSIHWMSLLEQPSKLYSSGLPCLYDMNFFLAVLGTIFDQKIGVLDPRRMIESNAVGMVIVGLSHESIDVRKTCHYILAEFHQVLNDGDSRERNQVLLLLNMLKNAIVSSKDDSHPIVPSLITMFVAHSISILIKPESYLYPLVNKFTLQRPVIDLEDVPMFYELFYSANEENRMERMWMLKLLLHGLHSGKDYLIFKRRHVIEILFGYFHSPLADVPGRKLVFQVYSINEDYLQSIYEFIHHLWYDYEIRFAAVLQSVLQSFDF